MVSEPVEIRKDFFFKITAFPSTANPGNTPYSEGCVKEIQYISMKRQYGFAVPVPAGNDEALAF